MEIATWNSPNKFELRPPKLDASSRDISIILGYSVFALVMLIAIYLAGSGSGTAPADFADMTVFP